MRSSTALNLTWETLEGTIKHNGPLAGPLAAADRVSSAIAEFNETVDLDLEGHAGPEAQVAAMADDIAYNNHDIDDGLRAGLFALEDLEALDLVGPVLREVKARYPALEPGRLIHETTRRVINLMVNDLLDESRRRLESAMPASAAAVREAGGPLIGFSAQMLRNDEALKGFLFERMYRHYRVNRMTSKVRRVVRRLFDQYVSEPECLPDEWREATDGAKSPGTARLVADYIAGMTDRFALAEYDRLFDVNERT